MAKEQKNDPRVEQLLKVIKSASEHHADELVKAAYKLADEKGVKLDKGTIANMKHIASDSFSRGALFVLQGV